MPYIRRRRGYIRRPLLKKTKYSMETYCAAAVPPQSGGQPQPFLTNTTYSIGFVAPTNVLGTRKVKNFTLSIFTNAPQPFFFALIYVPQGTNPSVINFGTTIADNIVTPLSLYEPNQNVIITGLVGGGDNADTLSGNKVERFKSRLARNLNSGDSIVLVFRPVADTPSNCLIQTSLSYAIAY